MKVFSFLIPGLVGCGLGFLVLSTPAAGQDPKPNGDDAPEPPAHVAPDPKSLTKVLKQLIDLHNQERKQAEVEDEAEELGPLEPDARLMAAALRHAEDMAKAGQSGHLGSDESTMITRTQEAGYRYRNLGENVAGGQRTPEQAMDGWMHSEGHRKNILGPDFTQIGVAMVRSRKGINFWCVVFGRPLVKPDKGKPESGPGQKQ